MFDIFVSIFIFSVDCISRKIQDGCHQLLIIIHVEWKDILTFYTCDNKVAIIVCMEMLSVFVTLSMHCREWKIYNSTLYTQNLVPRATNVSMAFVDYIFFTNVTDCTK